MRVSIIASALGQLSLFTHEPPKLGYSSREGRGGFLTAME